MTTTRRFTLISVITACISLAGTSSFSFAFTVNTRQGGALLHPYRHPLSLSSSTSTADDISDQTSSSSVPPRLRIPSPPRIVSDRVFDVDKRPIVLFDGVCNLCNSAVNTALDWDPRGKLRFAALQSRVGQALLEANGRDANDISSIVLVTESGAYTKSDAILRIAAELNPVPFLPMNVAAKAGMFLIPRFVRDLIYDGVADNRYRILGKRDECRFDADGEFDDRFVDDDLAME